MLDPASISMIAALVILVILSAFFSATETAFTSLNRIRLKSRADSGNKRAALTLRIAEDYDKLLSTNLIGNNIVNISASTVGTVLFTKLFLDYGPLVSTVVLTVVILVFGEISPKSMAKENAEAFAMFAAPIMRVLMTVLAPVNYLFAQWKKLLSRIFRKSEEEGITEEELITMVDQAENEGGLDQHEGQLIRSAIEFNDLEVEEILTPRVDIVAAEDTATMDEIAAIFAENGYSRLPIYHDTIDNIIGVIHEKDFHAARYHGQEDVSAIVSNVLYTTGSTKKMSYHGFCRTYFTMISRLFAQSQFDRSCLKHIIHMCAGSMCIDIIDFFRFYAGIFHRKFDSFCCTASIFCR